VRKAAWLLVACVLVGGGCGSGKDETLTVFAAASLTKALDGDGQQHSFAGSQQLVAQIEAGAPADVVVTADTKTMDGLAAKKLVEGAQVVATNSLVIAVQPGNPKGVQGLADLGRNDLAVVLADPAVPAGRYAAEVLGRVGIVVRPKSLELDVESALQKVVLREADASIVYVTDAGAGMKAVAIPAEQNVVVRYAGAVVRSTGHRAEARGYVRGLPALLQKAGFGPPPSA
jgi:molybdate transport system substrate-binding protein